MHVSPVPEAVTAYRTFLDKLDAQLAQAQARYGGHMQCKAGCFSCCKNDFHISPIEARELLEAVQALPNTTREHIRSNLEAIDTTTCPLLVEGNCSIYAQRPVLCRIFGFPVFDGADIQTCELNFTELRDGDFRGEALDKQVLGRMLQALSTWYLQECPVSVERDNRTITEILAGVCEGISL